MHRSAKFSTGMQQRGITYRRMKGMKERTSRGEKKNEGTHLGRRPAAAHSTELNQRGISIMHAWWPSLRQAPPSLGYLRPPSPRRAQRGKPPWCAMCEGSDAEADQEAGLQDGKKRRVRREVELWEKTPGCGGRRT